MNKNNPFPTTSPRPQHKQLSLLFPSRSSSIREKLRQQTIQISHTIMVRASHVFLVALVLFNIIVLSSGAAEAPKASAPSNDTTEVDDDYEGVIGTGDSGAPSPNSVVAGPIGGPVPPGAFDEANKATASATSATTSSLNHFSALAGAAAATAVAGFFYF